MASAAQRVTRAGNRAAVPTPEKVPAQSPKLSGLIPVTPGVAQQYRGYKALVDRAIQAFGDELTASRWLSMPSVDLNGKVPLQVAQSIDYDAAQVETIFEPIFIRIEHGIYV